MALATLDRRPLGALGRIGVVAGIHLAALYALASMGVVSIGVESGPLVTTVIDERVPDEPPPPLPPYQPSEPGQVTLPTPDAVPIPMDPPEAGITAEFVPPGDLPEGTGSAVPVPPLLVGVRADPRYPVTRPPYPAEMIRADKEGVVGVEVYVGANGRVTDARIFKSSGFSSFDRSTIDEAKRKWRFLPATRDGVPQAQWHRLQVVFKLTNQ